MSTDEGRLYGAGVGNPNVPEMDAPEMKLHLRILVVDHNIGSLLHVKSILEDLSHQVITAEGARSAFRILQNDDQYDVVIADTDLPGIEMSLFVQIVRLYFDIPIIMMSPRQLNMYRDYNMVSAAMRLGVCFFYSKPVSWRELRYVWQIVYRVRRDEYEVRRMLNIMSAESASVSSSVSSSATGGIGDSHSGMHPNGPRL